MHQIIEPARSKQSVSIAEDFPGLSEDPVNVSWRKRLMTTARQPGYSLAPLSQRQYVDKNVVRLINTVAELDKQHRVGKAPRAD